MSVPRRIALVLQSTAVGGMETHVVDLAHEYRRRGIDVLAVVPEGEAFDALAARFETRRVVRLTTDGRDGRRAQLARLGTFARGLRTFRPDVVHLHTGGATGGLAVVAIARAVTGATVAISEHDVPASDARRAALLARCALDHTAHLVVAVSRRNAAIRRERAGMGCDSFASILNGVPLPCVGEAERRANRARVRRALRLAEDDVVIGSLVRLAEGKGLNDLLTAFARVRALAPRRLLLVGDGPLRGGLEALAGDLGIRGDVVFAGSQAEPGPYLDAMDAFCLAVPAGSMSIALLEAMARGLPPVITFCGPEEAVIDGETGLGAKPNDPEDLARALHAMATDKALRLALGRRAAAHVARHFSVGRVADDLLEAYATARDGRLSERLCADGPPNPYPGGMDSLACPGPRFQP